MAKKMKIKKVVEGLEEVEKKTQKRAEKMSSGRDAAVKLQIKKLPSGLELAPMSREELDKPSKDAHKKGMETRELKEKIKKKYKIKREPNSVSKASDGAKDAHSKAIGLKKKSLDYKEKAAHNMATANRLKGKGLVGDTFSAAAKTKGLTQELKGSAYDIKSGNAERDSLGKGLVETSKHIKKKAVDARRTLRKLKIKKAK